MAWSQKFRKSEISLDTGSRYGSEIFQIRESDSCSDSGYNHRFERNLPMFLPKKCPHWLLLLPKLQSDSGSGSVFSQIFDSGSGSERKTQNPAGFGSGTPDPWPSLAHMGWSQKFRKSEISLDTESKYFPNLRTPFQFKLCLPPMQPKFSNVFTSKITFIKTTETPTLGKNDKRPRIRGQAKFLTWYCLSVILLLRIKKKFDNCFFGVCYLN